MYICFKLADGSNPYVSTTDAKALDMFTRYITEQTAPNTFEVLATAQFLTAHTGKKISGYTKRKTALRELAIDWQSKYDEMCYSWSEICDWGAFFETTGRKYGLLKEFRANGLC